MQFEYNLASLANSDHQASTTAATALEHTLQYPSYAARSSHSNFPEDNRLAMFANEINQPAYHAAYSTTATTTVQATAPRGFVPRVSSQVSISDTANYNSIDQQEFTIGQIFSATNATAPAGLNYYKLYHNNQNISASASFYNKPKATAAAMATSPLSIYQTISVNHSSPQVNLSHNQTLFIGQQYQHQQQQDSTIPSSQTTRFSIQESVGSVSTTLTWHEQQSKSNAQPLPSRDRLASLEETSINCNQLSVHAPSSQALQSPCIQEQNSQSPTFGSSISQKTQSQLKNANKFCMSALLNFLTETLPLHREWQHLLKYIMRIKGSGKLRQKVDIFTLAHFRVLFLTLNDWNISQLNESDIETHRIVFSEIVKPILKYEATPTTFLNRLEMEAINSIKAQLLPLSLHFFEDSASIKMKIQSKSWQKSDTAHQYIHWVQRISKGIQKMTSGVYIHRF